jgi:flavin reductase (DIM6/NTAB) family NADH-FMN oxidoreductase RutF
VTAQAADFIAAMGQHVSSVCVITALHEGTRYGLTATAVSSVSAAPPRLLVCVNRSGLSHEMIAASGHFCVNVLSESQDALARSFAGMAAKGVDRFASGDWRRLASGAPVLANAVAAFDCAVAERIQQSTHTVFIGDVLAAQSGTGRDPLLYGARRFRTLSKSAASGEGMEMLHF